MPISTIKFGTRDITRLIVGGNPLRGNSHVSADKDAEMREYYTDENVVALLAGCEKAGINTIQARGDFYIMNWLEMFRRQGGRLHWIAQTASEMTDVFQNIRILSAAGAMAVYHHGTRTDTFWNEGRIDEANDYLKCMRDSGVLVGLGTHNPRVVEYSESKGWDVDFYMTCFYNLSRTPRESAIVSGRAAHADEKFFDEDREKMCETIRGTPKTCLAFKILAASRKCKSQQEVGEAFQYAFDNIKPNDAVVVGMFPKYEDQVAINAKHAMEAMKK